MLKISLIVITISVSFTQTTISGEISGFLSVENSPYFVVDELILAQNDSLIIEAGSQIIFMGNHRIRIDSSTVLLAEGTAEDSIIFTYNQNDYEPIENQFWGGMRLLHSGEKTIIFRYCIIEYMGPIPTGTPYAGVLGVYDSNIIIDHCLIQKNSGNSMGGESSGVSITESKGIITNSVFKNNGNDENNFDVVFYGGAINFWGARPGTVVKNCLIYNNYAGMGGGVSIAFSGDNVIFENTLFAYNYALTFAGAAYIVFNSYPVFNNCIFNGNTITDPNEYPTFVTFYSHDEISIGSSILDDDNCLWKGHLEGWEFVPDENECGCDCPYYDFINVDPLHVDVENSDFSLQPASPAINAGTGEPDPDGSPPDIGPIYYHLTKGDVNFDDQINVMDIIAGIQFILLISEPLNSQAWTFDTNDDGNLNVLDIIQIVNVILEG